MPTSVCLRVDVGIDPYVLSLVYQTLESSNDLDATYSLTSNLNSSFKYSFLPNEATDAKITDLSVHFSSPLKKP